MTNPLAQNIAFGVDPDQIDMERVKEVARLAELWTFIENELPRQLDTIVGDRGSALSRGQRQRVGIARALYHNPEILVLDEATSNLDPVTESKVLRNLASLAPKRTLIMVTHRVQTALSCDRIGVVSEGELVGLGQEEELRESCQAFLDLLTVSI